MQVLPCTEHHGRTDALADELDARREIPLSEICNVDVFNPVEARPDLSADTIVWISIQRSGRCFAGSTTDLRRRGRVSGTQSLRLRADESHHTTEHLSSSRALTNWDSIQIALERWA